MKFFQCFTEVYQPPKSIRLMHSLANHIWWEKRWQVSHRILIPGLFIRCWYVCRNRGGACLLPPSLFSRSEESITKKADYLLSRGQNFGHVRRWELVCTRIFDTPKKRSQRPKISDRTSKWSEKAEIRSAFKIKVTVEINWAESRQHLMPCRILCRINWYHPEKSASPICARSLQIKLFPPGLAEGHC